MRAQAPGAAGSSGRAQPDRHLRRADWRFLLPYPPDGRFEHLVLLGGPSWLPELVAELGVARRVSRGIPPKSSADALALLRDAKVDVAEAFACVRAGGAVYWEVARGWGSFLRSTPRAIRRRLLEAGLTPLAIYWPRQGFRYATMYTPMGIREALGWYVETFLQPRNPARRAARFFLRFLARAGATWPFGLMPRYAAVAAAGPADRGAFDLKAGTPSGTVENREQLPLVLLRGWDPSRRVIIFLFSPGSRRPSAVVKFWRLPHRNLKTESEQETLRRIRSLLDPAMAQTLPQPLGTFRWGEIVAAVESYAPGPPLSNFTNTWARPLRRKLEDLRLVLDWISDFHRQAQLSREPLDRTALRELIEEPLSKYRDAFGLTSGEERLFAAVRQRARGLLGMPLPVLWAHPDLTASNIHICGRQVTVIDWSGATPRLPLFDLLYFVMLWTEAVKRERGLAARLRRFRETFIGCGEADTVVNAVREGVRRYLESLEIDGQFLPILLTLSWVAWSLECCDRQQEVERGDSGANPHPGESYVEYVQLLAGESETLFSQARPWW